MLRSGVPETVSEETIVDTANTLISLGNLQPQALEEVINFIIQYFNERPNDTRTGLLGNIGRRFSYRYEDVEKWRNRSDVGDAAISIAPNSRIVLNPDFKPWNEDEVEINVYSIASMGPDAALSALRSFFSPRQDPRKIPQIIEHSIELITDLGEAGSTTVAQYLGEFPKSTRSKSEAPLHDFIRMISVLNVPDAIPVLASMIDLNTNCSFSTRLLVTQALGMNQSRPEISIPALEKVLSNSKSKVLRRLAATALGQYGVAAKAALPTLEKYSCSWKSGLREAASLAAKQVRDQSVIRLSRPANAIQIQSLYPLNDLLAEGNRDDFNLILSPSGLETFRVYCAMATVFCCIWGLAIIATILLCWAIPLGSAGLLVKLILTVTAGGVVATGIHEMDIIGNLESIESKGRNGRRKVMVLALFTLVPLGLAGAAFAACASAGLVTTILYFCTLAIGREALFEALVIPLFSIAFVIWAVLCGRAIYRKMLDDRPWNPRKSV